MTIPRIGGKLVNQESKQPLATPTYETHMNKLVNRHWKAKMRGPKQLAQTLELPIINTTIRSAIVETRQKMMNPQELT